MKKADLMERKDELLVALDNLMKKYCDIASMSSGTDESIIIKIDLPKSDEQLAQEASDSAFFKKLAGKVIQDREYPDDAYLLPEAQFIQFGMDDWAGVETWLTTKALVVGSRGEVGKRDREIELGETEHIFKSRWRVFDNPEDYADKRWMAEN